MINEKLMNTLLDEFEKVITKNGVNCLRVADRAEFLRKVYENEMVYDGFVIIKSSKQSGIFYVDTEELIGRGGMYRAPRPLKKSDFDIPSPVPPLNTSLTDAIELD
jgi:hypothetical protein